MPEETRDSLAGRSHRSSCVTLVRLEQFRDRIRINGESSVIHYALDSVVEKARRQVMAQTVADLLRESVELDDSGDLDIRS